MDTIHVLDFQQDWAMARHQPISFSIFSLNLANCNLRSTALANHSSLALVNHRLSTDTTLSRQSNVSSCHTQNKANAQL